MYEDGIDGDSLKEVVANAIKTLHIGAAVLPKPLLCPDVDELLGDFSCVETNETREGRAPEKYSISQIPTRYARTLRNEFNAIVIEHHLKWAPLCVSEPGVMEDGSPPCQRLGRYDFHHADAIVDWAIKQKMIVKGHVLVWHITSPQFLENMSSAEVREQLRRHIFTTMGHFKGRIKVWDVVNEALAPDGKGVVGFELYCYIRAFSCVSFYFFGFQLQALWRKMFSFEKLDQGILKSVFDGHIKLIPKLFYYIMTTK
mmetsp:Transcript_15466/g.15378  ORF Transcript_15466/g.15378 Transcript_15466/m.15378 type:complete len:257 (+) Transcript_15466:136-906(+)